MGGSDGLLRSLTSSGRTGSAAGAATSCGGTASAGATTRAVWRLVNQRCTCAAERLASRASASSSSPEGAAASSPACDTGEQSTRERVAQRVPAPSKPRARSKSVQCPWRPREKGKGERRACRLRLAPRSRAEREAVRALCLAAAAWREVRAATRRAWQRVLLTAVMRRRRKRGGNEGVSGRRMPRRRGSLSAQQQVQIARVSPFAAASHVRGAGNRGYVAGAGACKVSFTYSSSLA
jgi:hypothetical protein